MLVHHTKLCYLLVIYLLATNVSTVSCCHQKYTKRPLNGYHCVHGHYASIINISRPYCTQICLKDRRCASLSFNMETNFCQLSHEPCAVADVKAGFLLMNFRWNEDENCVTWKTNDVETGGFVPERLVEEFAILTSRSAVGRIQIGEDIHMGVGDHIAASGDAFFCGKRKWILRRHQLQVVDCEPNLLPGLVAIQSHGPPSWSSRSGRIPQWIGLYLQHPSLAPWHRVI